MGQRHARTNAGEAPRSHRYGDYVELGDLETGAVQTISCHDRQDGGVTALKVPLKPNDDCTSRNEGRRTPANRGVKGEDEHRRFKLSKRSGAKVQAIRQASSNGRRGDRLNRPAGSP
jgi:hypothetical protein